MLMPFVQGFGISGGLIVAIGAQNAYVLSQSVRKNHHLAVAAVCIVCEIALIGAGVAGVGAVVAHSPAMMRAAALAGAAFLLWYGLCAFRAAVRGGRLEISENGQKTLRAAIAGTLAVTILNPHAYLDTVVLIGSVSATFEGAGRLYFGLGALAASVVWFLGLTAFGHALAPVFRREISWKILDGLIGCVMWSIAASLLYFGLSPAS